MSGSDVLGALRERLADDVEVTEAPPEEHSHDWAPAALLAARAGAPPQRPRAAAYPRRTEDVAEIVRWAAENSVPLVPFGGGSGVLRAIAPGSDAVVVDLRRMDNILDVDHKSRLVSVQAGISGPSLGAALTAEGLFLGHEPQSFDISTVGGWISTRAMGQLSGRYGGIDDLLAGLEVVLPDGSVVARSVVPRSATGPDVASLFVGAEGALGFVTAATLRVSPTPETRTDICLRFERMDQAVGAVRAIAQSDLRPTMLRLYDREDAAIFLMAIPDEVVEPLLIMSFDGWAHERRATAACELTGARAGSAALVDRWWGHRNDAIQELDRIMGGAGILGPHGLVDTIEVAGTWSVLRGLYHSLKEVLSVEADHCGCHISHVYPDGACLYFTLAAACESDDVASQKLERWWQLGPATALAAGGTISHHHGIGRTKAPFLPQELGGWFDVLRQVKSILDPKGIMNPGVLGL